MLFLVKNITIGKFSKVKKYNSHHMLKISYLVIALAIFSVTYSQTSIRGVDLSFTPQIEDLGGVYKSNGVAGNTLDIFKANGVNYVRLRLWHTPSDGYCGLQKTLAFAKRIKEKGMQFLLDIHYSDSWADPGKQTKPAAWTNLSSTVLKDSVYSYTKNVITQLKNQNTLPDMVQIGNEIIQGMLWPDGKVSGSTGWVTLGDLLKKGIQGVKDAAGTSQIKIMLHIDKGGDNAGAAWWFDNIISQKVEFDVIGLSYYPAWHGTLSALEYNVNYLATKYGKEINIVETAYPWTLNWKDNTNNSIGLQSQLLSGYPATVQGQYDFMKALIGIINNIPNKKGTGFFYWAPDWISINQLGSSWENMTFFDFNGEVNKSIEVFNLGNPTSIKNVELPSSFQLEQNYPNPFNPTTAIKYTLKEAGHVTLKVCDLLGREVATLVDEYKPAGNYNSTFLPKASLRDNSQLQSGVYFYTMHTGTFVQTKKMMLLK